MRTTEPTVEEFSGNAVKYYAAVVEYNRYLVLRNEKLEKESTDPHTVKNLAKKNGELAGKLDKYKVEYKKIEEEVVSLRDLNLEFGETYDMQINRIKELEEKNKTLRESTIDECLAIAKEAFNHQWPLRSCVDKFIALKALNQEKDG